MTFQSNLDTTFNTKQTQVKSRCNGFHRYQTDPNQVRIDRHFDKDGTCTEWPTSQTYGCHQVQLSSTTTAGSHCRPYMYFHTAAIKCNCSGPIQHCRIVDHNCMSGGFRGFFENTDKFYGIWQNSDVKFKTENILFYKSFNCPPSPLIAIKWTQFAKRTVFVSICKAVSCTFSLYVKLFSKKFQVIILR